MRCFVRTSWFSWVEYSLCCACEAKWWSGVTLTSSSCTGQCSSPNSTSKSTNWSSTEVDCLATKVFPCWRSERESLKCATPETSGCAWSVVRQSPSSLAPRPDPTSFERRFLKEFEESFRVLAEFFAFEVFARTNRLAHMLITPNLHVSMSHVEKLADLLVLLPPIFPLMNLGKIQGGLTYSFGEWAMGSNLFSRTGSSMAKHLSWCDCSKLDQCVPLLF
jgi:hypothetical protein